MTLPLPCISLIQSFLKLQFATCGTTITAVATITAEITDTDTDVAAAAVHSAVVIAVVVTAVVTVVNNAVAIANAAIAAADAAADAAATVTVYIHATANAHDILSSIFARSANHPAFSLLFHTRRYTIHTLRLATNHASTVHTTTLTRLK
jgi:hypothetical protein